MKKRWLISLSTLSVAIAPIAVVSCSATTETKKEDITKVIEPKIKKAEALRDDYLAKAKDETTKESIKMAANDEINKINNMVSSTSKDNKEQLAYLEEISKNIDKWLENFENLLKDIAEPNN